MAISLGEHLNQLRGRLARDRFAGPIIEQWKTTIDSIGPMHLKFAHAARSIHLSRMNREIIVAVAIGAAAIATTEFTKIGKARQATAFAVPTPIIDHPPTSTRIPNAPATESPQDKIAQIKLSLADARARCLDELYETAQYQSAFANVERLEAEVKLLRRSDPGGDLPGISLRWIHAKSELAHLTTTTLDHDPDVQKGQLAMQGLGLFRTQNSPIAGKSPSGRLEE